MKGKTTAGRKKNYISNLVDIGLDPVTPGADLSGYKPNKVHDYQVSDSFIDRVLDSTSFAGIGLNILKEIFGSGKKITDDGDFIEYKGKKIYLGTGEELADLYNAHNEEGKSAKEELAGVYVKKLGRTYINRKLFDDSRLHHLIEPTIRHEEGHGFAYHVLPKYGIVLDGNGHEDFAEEYEIDPVRALKKLGLEVS